MEKDSLDQEIEVDSTDIELLKPSRFDRSQPTETANKSVKDSIKIADEGLDEPVIYGARDTMWFNHPDNEVHLYGEAFVEYQEMKLNAGYIILNLETNIAEAQTIAGVDGSRQQKPTFFDGNKEIKYNALRYNFETQKGLVFDAITTEGGLIVHGKKTKYISSEKDSSIHEDVIYNQSALVTSCNHEHPHFGFRTSKLKVIPDKIAVVGPANLEIAGIPTPLFIPFGFFPLAQGQSSGFIFPRDYEYSPTKGFGLRDFGWYFPVNDYLDVILTGDIYTRGSFGININSRFKKRYKYNGHFNFSYDDTRVEDTETAEVNSRRSFSIDISHNQDSKAHPYRTIGGSIFFQTDNHNAFTNNDAASVSKNIYSSNFYFRHDMPNTPFKFNAGLKHSQNTSTRSIDITFPDMSLNMPSQYPFRNKSRGSADPKWYESVNVSYNTKLKNFIESTDTTLFKENILDNMFAGMEHKLNGGLNLKFLKYINFNASANYTERWYLKSFERGLDETTLNEVVLDTINGFASNRTYGVSAGINTQLFWTQQFSKGLIRGFRHKITPKFSFSYGPDTKSRFEEVYLDEDGMEVSYNPFPNSPFRSPFSSENMSFNYQFDNNLEIKYYSKKDSSFKKLKLFDTFSIRGSNNLIADSLNWSKVTMNSNSRLFSGITTISLRFTFDPYLEENGQRINKTVWSDRKRLLRLDNGFIKVTNRFSVKRIKELFGWSSKDKSSKSTNSSGVGANRAALLGEDIGVTDSNQQEDGGFEKVSIGSLFDNLRFVHDFQYNWEQNDGIDTSFVQRHSASVTGSIPLTPNWNVSIGNIGYDFKNNGLNYPSFTFTRKLHCWYMNFSWQPNRDTYSFFIGVSANAFNFLKYNYGQNNVDGFFGRGR